MRLTRENAPFVFIQVLGALVLLFLGISAAVIGPTIWVRVLCSSFSFLTMGLPIYLAYDMLRSER